MGRTLCSSCSHTTTSTTIGTINKASSFLPNRLTKHLLQPRATRGFPHHLATVSLSAADVTTSVSHLPGHHLCHFLEPQLNHIRSATAKLALSPLALPAIPELPMTIIATVIIQRLENLVVTPTIRLDQNGGARIMTEQQYERNRESAGF